MRAAFPSGAVSGPPCRGPGENASAAAQGRLKWAKVPEVSSPFGSDSSRFALLNAWSTILVSPLAINIQPPRPYDGGGPPSWAAVPQAMPNDARDRVDQMTPGTRTTR